MLYDDLHKWVVDNLVSLTNKNTLRTKSRLLDVNGRFYNDNIGYFDSIIDFTRYLPDDAPMSRRVFHIYYRVHEIPKCTCGNNLRYDNFSRGYFKHCSSKCAQNDDNVRKVYKNTIISKYGVDNPSKSEDIKRKKAKTCYKHYGVCNPFESDEIKDKIRETNLSRYGVYNPAKNDVIKNKISVKSKQNSGRSIAKARITKLKKYDDANHVNKAKHESTMLERYGVKHNWQNGELRDNYYATMLSKYGVKHPLQSDSIKAKAIYRKRSNSFDDIRYSYTDLTILTTINYNIPGLFSKMLSRFIKDHNPKRIISFADRRYTFRYNNVYINNGFSFVKMTKPNYWYFKRNIGILRHRFNFIKSTLKDKLDTFDPNKSEYENMLNNGWFRIFDCGNLRYELCL